ncbi:MAG: amino acid kinase family protein [Candidatus Helarchaeota archaeon]
MIPFKTIIKLGGSIVNYTVKFKELCEYLQKLISKYYFIIIPGGGIFADNVRIIDKKFNLNDYHSHYMAILSMNLIGYLIHSQIINSKLISELEHLNYEKWLNSKNKIIPIFLPFNELIKTNSLPYSWDVSSDSIAYYLGCKLNMDKIILIKNVDGIFNKDPNKYQDCKLIEVISTNELKKMENSCVDKYLPDLINKCKKECYLVNGMYPSRILDIIENRKTEYTIIKVKEY